MKKTFTEFKTMLLRPACYNGAQFEAELVLDESDLYRESLDIVRALGMPVGDTVRVRGKIGSEEERKYSEYVSIYMSGDVLDEFISRFGIENITATLMLKLELVYSVYESTDYRCEAMEDEIIGFRLLEIC